MPTKARGTTGEHRGDSMGVLVATIVIAGYAHSASAAWPFDLNFESLLVHRNPVWWLQLASMMVLVFALHRCANVRQAITLALAFSTTWLVGTFWWLFISMHTYGGLPAPLAAIAVVALALALALYYGAAMALYWHLRACSGLLRGLVFAALWTMAELARGTWLTGFGWGAVGYTHVDGPLQSAIPWLGMYGVGVLAAWVAASLAPHSGTVLTRAVAGLVLVLGGWFGAGQSPAQDHWTESTGRLQVSLLQGNIAQSEKFEANSGVPMALQWYADQLQSSTSDVVVAPETAIPVLAQELPQGYWELLERRFSQGEQAALIGIPLGNFSEGYTNSVLALLPGEKQPLRYDKHHLVPFGEFIPPLFKWFTRLMNIPLGDFSRGAIGQPSFSWKGQRLAAHICYEDLFGEELGARFGEPELAPTVLVNLSNIAWFGNSVAIDQHLQISRMRAVEFQRPMIRATNTGATAAIDHRGRITHQLPPVTRGVLHANVEGRRGTTPYAWWVAHFGLWPLWCLGIAIVFIAAYARIARAR